MAATPEVVQDLRVHSAVTDGDDVIVSVYGGEHNVCGTVKFTFEAEHQRRHVHGLAEEWAATDQVVTLLAAEDTVSLFVEQEAFDRACAS